MSVFPNISIWELLLFPHSRTSCLYEVKPLIQQSQYIFKCIIWVGKDAVKSLYCVPDTDISEAWGTSTNCLIKCFLSPVSFLFSFLWNETRKYLKIPESLEKSFKDTVSHILCHWQEYVRATYRQGALLFVRAGNKHPDSVAPIMKHDFTQTNQYWSQSWKYLWA